MSPPEPYAYAACKLPMLRRRWEGVEGEAVRRFGPRLWPGAPATALLGLSASSMGLGEVVGQEGAEASAVGLFGVERPMVARYTDPATPEGREAAEFLGRPVRAGLTAAGYLGDVEGQVVTGLLNYARHFAALLEVAPRAVFAGMPRTTTTSLVLRCAAAAYSSGEGVIGAGLNAFGAELGAVGWELRWPTYAGKVAGTPATVLGRVAVDGPWKVAFNIVRAEERAASGELLEDAVNAGRERAWFLPWARGEAAPVVERLIVRGGFDRVSSCSGGTSGVGSGGSSSASSGAGLGELAVVGALAYGAWKLWR